MTSETLLAGRYRLGEQIGVGGMGRIWLAHDQVLLREVAVKEFRPPAGLSATQIDGMRAMMLREAQAAAQIVHPNVVRIYDVVRSRGNPWIIMEYVASKSLQRIVSSSGPVAVPYAASVGLALLDALAATHRRGVLHRDITPQNVLIADDGRTMLADFGAAIFPGAQRNADADLIGTARYMAPERVRSGVSTVEGDYWSLGATLYLAVEGVPPYPQRSTVDALSALLTVAPAVPRFAGALRPVLEGLLARDPMNRWRPGQTRDQLRRVIDQSVGVPQGAPVIRSLVKPLPAGADAHAVTGRYAQFSLA